MSRRRKKAPKQIPVVFVKVPHEKLEETIESMATEKFPAFDVVCNALVKRETKQIVSLGIGDPCSSLGARTQLSFLLKVCRKCGIESKVFSDPVLCGECAKLLSDWGFVVDSEDKVGKYEFSSDVMFFMPHCPRFLFHNLLVSNWSVEKMKNVFIVGNSFAGYSENCRMLIQRVRTAIEDLYDTEMIEDKPLDFGDNQFFSEMSMMTFKEPNEKVTIFETPPEFLHAMSLV